MALSGHQWPFVAINSNYAKRLSAILLDTLNFKQNTLHKTTIIRQLLGSYNKLTVPYSVDLKQTKILGLFLDIIPVANR